MQSAATTDYEEDARAGTFFVLVFDSLVSSGLLASLSGNAYKALMALGLAASPLGSGSQRSQAFFQDLCQAGIVSSSDRGRLFCGLDHRELMRRTGLSKNTLSRCTAELETRQMIEKRRVRQADGTAYNLFFLLPGCHLDKFHTFHHGGDSGVGRPKTGTDCIPGPIFRANRVPEDGTNDNTVFSTTTPTSTGRAMERQGGLGSGASARPDLGTGSERRLDADAALAHFARRRADQPAGLPAGSAYRPTSHDRRKLAVLQEAGYSLTEVLAAIDRAFDDRPADAPPIRMFSYCATIALATPPRQTAPTPGVTGCAPPAGPLPPVADASWSDSETAPVLGDEPPAHAGTEAATPPVLAHARQLYQLEVGPVTPLVDRELRRLAAQHPDPAAWDTAFGEAVRANVRQLRYVSRVLESRAAGASRADRPDGRRSVPPGRGRFRRSRAGTRRGAQYIIDEELAEAQRKAAAVEPLDLETVLGTPHA